MKIVIAGGSGLIGKRLIGGLVQARHEVILLSRSPERNKKNFSAVRVEYWDANVNTALAKIIDGADAIINLTGESIAARRWTPAQKKRILSSRINSTRAIVNAIEQADRRPGLLINASASGYYGNVPDGDVTEENQKGKGFLADVCGQWEMEALKARSSGVRVVLLRSGIVLDKNSGALQKLLQPFKLFVGGPFGSGKQWFPWIHIQDEVNAIIFAMEHEQINGAVNLAAPQSVRMTEFCKVLGKVLHRPSWFSVPDFFLKIALGEMAKPLLLDGQRVIPQKLLDAGFKFQFQNLDEALIELLG